MKVLLQDLGPVRKCDLKSSVGDLKTAICDKLAWRNETKKTGQSKVPSFEKIKRSVVVV